MKIINVTGIGNSGKGAVVDLLRSFSNTWAPASSFEFDFFRINGGMIDFLEIISKDNSSIKTDMAFKRLKSNCIKMGINPKIIDLRGHFISTGHRYDRLFSGNFTKITNEFLDDLVERKIKAYWPFDRLEKSYISNFFIKFFSRIGFSSLDHSFIHQLNKDELDKKFDKYIQDLFSCLGDRKYGVYVMNNFFDPYHINDFVKWFRGVKSIVVIRDPRDIYVSGLSGAQINKKNKKLLPQENDGKEKSFLGTNDLDFFINRYKKNMESIDRGFPNSQLIIRFEDLIYDHKNTKKRILDFLEMDLGHEDSQESKFNPKLSMKNTFIWKKYDGADEIDRIKLDLKDYIFDK